MARTISKDIRRLHPKRLGGLAPTGKICPQHVDERDDQTIPIQPTNWRITDQSLPNDRTNND